MIKMNLIIFKIYDDYFITYFHNIFIERKKVRKRSREGESVCQNEKVKKEIVNENDSNICLHNKGKADICIFEMQ